MSELETEFGDKGDKGATVDRIIEVMDALDVEQSTQDLALAILKEDGLQAVQVRRLAALAARSKPARGRFCVRGRCLWRMGR